MRERFNGNCSQAFILLFRLYQNYIMHSCDSSMSSVCCLGIWGKKNWLRKTRGRTKLKNAVLHHHFITLLSCFISIKNLLFFSQRSKSIHSGSSSFPLSIAQNTIHECNWLRWWWLQWGMRLKRLGEKQRQQTRQGGEWKRKGYQIEKIFLPVWLRLFFYMEKYCIARMELEKHFCILEKEHDRPRSLLHTSLHVLHWREKNALSKMKFWMIISRSLFKDEVQAKQ